MDRRRPIAALAQRHTGYARRVFMGVAVLLTLGLLSACATESGNLAPEESLQPAGWLNIESTLSGSRFNDYADDVRQRLIQHRIPLVPENAELEVERAAPVQINPDSSCKGETRGIAILVHGLSDTAFTMRDLAHYFASQCYIARTVLLPGHGTRAGDLLVVKHTDWTNTVRHLTQQAAQEHDRIVLVGFSLGAIVVTTVALDENSPVDALVVISPAYNISTWSYARFAHYVHRLYRWIDKGQADDSMRYESMPTRGVAEFVRGLKVMKDRIGKRGGYKKPWMLIQSMQDNTTVPVDNQAFVLSQSTGSVSHVLNFYTDNKPDANNADVSWLSGTDEDLHVNGLSHLAVHIAPDNVHYGVAGDYRHCGGVDGRDAVGATQCLEAKSVDYVDWDRIPQAGSRPTAISSFNPRFDQMTAVMSTFLNRVE